MGLARQLRRAAKLSPKVTYQTHPSYLAAEAIEELVWALGVFVNYEMGANEDVEEAKRVYERYKHEAADADGVS